MSPARVTRIAEVVVLAGALALAVGAAGAPGWGDAADLATAAHRLEGVPPGQPAHAMLGKFAALVPVGDIGFRVAALSAIAMVIALAGVVALARALVPDERAAGVVAAGVLATTPGVGGAAAVAGTVAPVAALVTWACVFAVRARRGATGATGALGLAAALLAVQPVVGVCVLGAVAALVVRSRGAALALGAFVVAVVPAWWLVVRSAPVDLGTWVGGGVDVAGAGARLGRTAGALGAGGALLLAGLVGLGLGAATGLRGAAVPLVIAGAVLAGASISPGPELAPAMLVPVAAGLGPLAGAIARMLARNPSEWQRAIDPLAPGAPEAAPPSGPAPARWAIGAAASAPVVLLALLVPAGAAVDAGGDAPATAVREVAGELPAGPATFVYGSRELWSAARFERDVAGERPDVVPVPRGAVDAMPIAIRELRAGRPIGSDTPAFGRLDVRRAIPRGRGFQLLVEEPEVAIAPPPPARWPGATGAALSAELALARGIYEAARGRLDAAARAAGLADRFGAADLAVLAATVPVRPAMFAYVPDLGGGPEVQRDLLGDDLAWVAGLDPAPLDARAPAERRLHALWREILLGQRAPDDPAIAALGPAAVEATRELLSSR